MWKKEHVEMCICDFVFQQYGKSTYGFRIFRLFAPNFEEVDRAYWIRVVCACVRSSKTVHARVLKFHIWIPRGKIFDAHFLSCPSYLPFWSYAPLNKIGTKSDTCHIL